MNRISVAVQIERPRREVYDFAATPSTWQLWHPWFTGLSGITDRPLAVGEETTEQMRVAGRRVSVTWLLVERRAPRPRSTSARYSSSSAMARSHRVFR